MADEPTTDVVTAHPRCVRPDGHTCQKPSGRPCVDCGKPAGTLWGPLWCPECDADRLNRISAQMESLLGDNTPAATEEADRG